MSAQEQETMREASRDGSAVCGWRWDGPLTIEQAVTAWHAARDRAPVSGETYQVDLAGVDRLDTAGCQILLWLQRETLRQGAAWRLTGCTPAVGEVIALLGATELLMTAGHRVADEAGGQAR